MRRVFVFTAVVAALVAAGPASAGGLAVGLVSAPVALDAGEQGVAVFDARTCGGFIPGELKLTVTARNAATGESVTYPARRIGKTARYRARLTFPEAGRWTYTVDVNGWFTQELGSVRVQRAPEANSAAFWPLGGGMVLAFGAAALRLTRRRKEE